MTVPTAASA